MLQIPLKKIVSAPASYFSQTRRHLSLPHHQQAIRTFGALTISNLMTFLQTTHEKHPIIEVMKLVSRFYRWDFLMAKDGGASLLDRCQADVAIDTPSSSVKDPQHRSDSTFSYPEWLFFEFEKVGRLLSNTPEKIDRYFSDTPSKNASNAFDRHDPVTDFFSQSIDERIALYQSFNLYLLYQNLYKETPLFVFNTVGNRLKVSTQCIDSDLFNHPPLSFGEFKENQVLMIKIFTIYANFCDEPDATTSSTRSDLELDKKTPTPLSVNRNPNPHDTSIESTEPISNTDPPLSEEDVLGFLCEVDPDNLIRADITVTVYKPLQAQDSDWDAFLGSEVSNKFEVIQNSAIETFLYENLSQGLDYSSASHDQVMHYLRSLGFPYSEFCTLVNRFYDMC